MKAADLTLQLEHINDKMFLKKKLVMEPPFFDDIFFERYKNVERELLTFFIMKGNSKEVLKSTNWDQIMVEIGWIDTWCILS